MHGRHRCQHRMLVRVVLGRGHWSARTFYLTRYDTRLIQRDVLESIAQTARRCDSAIRRTWVVSAGWGRGIRDGAIKCTPRALRGSR